MIKCSIIYQWKVTELHELISEHENIQNNKIL